MEVLEFVKHLIAKDVDFCLDLKIGNQDFETVYPVPETVWHENSSQVAFYSLLEPSQEFCILHFPIWLSATWIQ